MLLIGGRDATAAPDRTILVLGDSLSAAYGIEPGQGWVALLQRRLEDQGYGYRVVNASVSGETSSGGLQRLPRALKIHQPDLVILELGSNDGLRGLPIQTTRANLQKMIRLAREAGAEVLLVGMRMPPNYGPRYTEQFTGMFADLAQSEGVALVPFFLDGVALDPTLMQDDGLHPNARAQPVLLETLWKHLAPLLRKP